MNCIVAQSGGPTAVINSSFIGVLTEAVKSGKYEKVFAGINGIEGILNEKIKDVTNLCEDDMDAIKHTPAAILGSCRYKLKGIKENSREYEKIFDIFREYDINTFFYIGGNDSMDTVKNLSAYAKSKKLDFRAVGIPKTIDNDLEVMDHTPGFASAAKFINTCIMETYLDDSVYEGKSVIILETMGREAGWLAASAVAARVDGKRIVDHIYVPEVPFNDMRFLTSIKNDLKKKDKVYIVVSEGIRYEDGSFVAQSMANGSHDKFGHAQLGGAAVRLKEKLMNSGIIKRVKAVELNILQRCAAHVSSDVDVEEAFQLGRHAVKFADEGLTGVLPGIIRTSFEPYEYEIKPIDIEKVANNTKFLPVEWVDTENDYMKDEMLSYIRPLMGKENTFPLYVNKIAE